VVRIPVALEPDGSIRCAGEIPENSLLVVCQAPDPRTGETGRALAARLGEVGLSGAMLLFYCAGRRLRLGSESENDLRGLLEASGLSAAGALSLGEIGSDRRGEYPSLHNGALVCVGWGRP
jgi:hypothetical protein